MIGCKQQPPQKHLFASQRETAGATFLQRGYLLCLLELLEEKKGKWPRFTATSVVLWVAVRMETWS